MGSLPVVLLLCSFHALAAVAQEPQPESSVAPAATLPPNCREEMYPCTRMYSVHRPIKQCVGAMCFYSLPRMYVINKEICMRTVCQQDEYRKAERCRELSGWPKRVERSPKRNGCHNRHGNTKPWANTA